MASKHGVTWNQNNEEGMKCVLKPGALCGTWADWAVCARSGVAGMPWVLSYVERHGKIWALAWEPWGLGGWWSMYLHGYWKYAAGTEGKPHTCVAGKLGLKWDRSFSQVGLWNKSMRTETEYQSSREPRQPAPIFLWSKSLEQHTDAAHPFLPQKVTWHYLSFKNQCCCSCF